MSIDTAPSPALAAAARTRQGVGLLALTGRILDLRAGRLIEEGRFSGVNRTGIRCLRAGVAEAARDAGLDIGAALEELEIGGIRQAVAHLSSASARAGLVMDRVQGGLQPMIELAELRAVLIALAAERPSDLHARGGPRRDR